MVKHLRATYLITCMVSLLSLTSFNEAVACEGHDLIITTITITSTYQTPSANVYSYSYQIKNIGTAGIALGEILLQNYVSANQTFEYDKDAAAGGAFIAYKSTDILAAGATYNGMYELILDLDHPVSSFPYFITDVYLDGETECDITNNTFVGLIELTATGTKPAHIASATVYWSIDTKSFSVNDWSGSYASALTYSVFTASGTLLFSGSTSEGQTTPLAALQSGMYILHLSDGDKMYSKKILY